MGPLSVPVAPEPRPIMTAVPQPSAKMATATPEPSAKMVAAAPEPSFKMAAALGLHMPELPALPWSPELLAATWSPELPALPWSPELQVPPLSPELPAPSWSPNQDSRALSKVTGLPGSFTFQSQHTAYHNGLPLLGTDHTHTHLYLIITSTLSTHFTPIHCLISFPYEVDTSPVILQCLTPCVSRNPSPASNLTHCPSLHPPVITSPILLSINTRFTSILLVCVYFHNNYIQTLYNSEIACISFRKLLQK